MRRHSGLRCEGVMLQTTNLWSHVLELAAFSPATINVMLFDCLKGADQCRSYACKYCDKPEPWYFLPTTGGEANPVKRFLQSRNVGLCMCHNRMLGFHVVRTTVSTQFLWPQFTVDAKTRSGISADHLKKRQVSGCSILLKRSATIHVQE